MMDGKRSEVNIILKSFAYIVETVAWAQQKMSKRQFIFLASILVGASVGFAAILLKLFVHWIFKLATYDKWSDFKYLYLILPVIGIFLTVWATYRILQGRLVKGLSQIHYAIAKKLSFMPRREMYDQILTSSLTVGFGGSTGLEAPIVVTGAAFGSNFAKTHHLNYSERTLLLACGIAAGIGAAFNAPIAGVLFALEVLVIDITISAFTPLIIAAATGALIAEIVLGDNILLSFDMRGHFKYFNVPFYMVLGVLSGIVSVYHSRIFTKVEGWFSKSKRNAYVKVMWGGLGLAALIFVFPSLFGEGYESIRSLATHRPEEIMEQSIFHQYRFNEFFLLLCIGVLIFVKAIATGLTLGSGGNGGNFAPSLFVGAYLGYFFSRVVNLLNISNIPESNFTMVGMAGILSGIYHAPLTSIFLIAEITGGYSLMIPLMIVSSISYAISRYFEPFSMDTKHMAEMGAIFTSDRDQNVLVTIKTSQFIEEDYTAVSPDMTLGQLVQEISGCKRNIFPVLNKNGQLLGLIMLDNIREVMFKTELYDKVIVRELMAAAPARIAPSQTMQMVMKRFDETGSWMLPVIEHGKFIGFISKTSVFNSYREKLKDNRIE